MATTLDKQTSSDSYDHTEHSRSGRRGSWVKRAVDVVLILGLVEGAIVAVVKYVVLPMGDPYAGMATYPVSRGKLVLTIMEDGNLESASNVDVKCEVAGGATILWIVEDGKEVQEGEV